MNVQIRMASAADIPELCRLRLAYFSEEFGSLPQNQLDTISAQLPVYFTEQLGKTCFAFAAALPNGHLAACALLTLVQKAPNPFFPNGRAGCVLGVFTEPEHRGNGFATQIMKMLLDQARLLKLDTVTLSASDMGRPIYEKLGFRVKESHFTEMEWFPA